MAGARCCSRHWPRAPAPRSRACPRQIARALAYIRANGHRRLGVEEIARAACCSASHLHVLFQRHLGTSPMDYAAEIRLDQAMSLLMESDEPISAIALETGHADQSVLTRSMKRRRGITPAEYRRRARPVFASSVAPAKDRGVPAKTAAGSGA